MARSRRPPETERPWSSPRTGTPNPRRTSRKTAGSGPFTASRTRGEPSSIPALAAADDAPRIRKGTNGEDGYSGFTMRDPVTGETTPTELNALLRERGIERVVVCGLATDYCVNATALDAIQLGFETFYSRTPSPRWTSARRRCAGDRRDARCRLPALAGPCALTGDDGLRTMQLHLVDATYELFRAHFAPRPDVRGRDGVILSGVSGLCDQLLYLLREEGATHVGCATDRVIESFRNDLFRSYKSSAGMAPELLHQFPIAEAAIEALGLVLWPMVEWEADDAIAAAARRFAADPDVEQIVVCTPDKDMAQLVTDKRVVLWDRRRGLTYDDAGVRAKWGVPPASIPDWLALVGDSSDGFPGLPGWGTKSAAAVLSVYGSLEGIPQRASHWEVPSLRGAPVLAATLREHWADALLYRDLARLRTTEDGVEIPQQSAEELRWDGVPRDRWEAFCDEWGLTRLRTRPHRWLGE